MGWQWHQLDHMQVICTSLQTDNHTTHHSSFLLARCSYCRPTNNVKALKALEKACNMWITFKVSKDQQKWCYSIGYTSLRTILQIFNSENCSDCENYYNHYNRFTTLCPGLPRWVGTRRINHSGFCWSRHDGVAVASSEPYASYLHFASPAPHQPDFYGPDALPDTQPTASKHWRQTVRSLQIKTTRSSTIQGPCECSTSVEILSTAAQL